MRILLLLSSLLVAQNMFAGALVSSDQAEYMRIKLNCLQIVQRFASTGGLNGSAIHNSLYSYLIQENSSAAKRVMEELIGSKILRDYRKSYGIKV